MGFIYMPDDGSTFFTNSETAGTSAVPASGIDLIELRRRAVKYAGQRTVAFAGLHIENAESEQIVYQVRALGYRDVAPGGVNDGVFQLYRVLERVHASSLANTKFLNTTTQLRSWAKIRPLS